MKQLRLRLFFLCIFFTGALFAQKAGNPVFPGWYADPEGMIFDNRYWIYPTYSAPYNKQVFMDAFSSPDMVNWTKHKSIIDTAAVKWAKIAMWAPSIIKKDNQYFLFFAANDIQNESAVGGIGIGVSDKPEGPFRDYLGKPLINKIVNGAQPIDQYVFQDVDGKYYMIYGGWRHCNIVRLSDDFKTILPHDDGTIYKEITPMDYVEGPIMFRRKGKVYFMWSEGGWTGPDYRVAYAIGDSPFGPFNRIGLILQQNASIATGAGHHSVINIPGTDDWYIVYHRRPLGETDGNARVTCIDKMIFDENGFIQPVVMTFDGVEGRKIIKPLKSELEIKVSVAKMPNPEVEKLYDGKSVTSFESKTNKTEVLFDFENPFKPTYYCLTSSGIDKANDPQFWTLKGSNDGKKWVNLDKRSGFKFYSRFHQAAFEISKPAAYRYFKLELQSAPKTKLTLGEISFAEGKTPKADWAGFIYPKVNYTDKDNKVTGSKIYHRLIHNPAAFIADHAQKVVSILYWTDKDHKKDIRTINYELRPDNGISAKGGDAPIIEIFYSADWVEKTATNKGDFDVLYETRGVLYHELTHGYQLEPKGCGSYRRGDEFFAFIEGVADAVRYEAGFFPVTNRRPGGNWMDGYQTTGFFLQWLTNKDVDFIRKFNKSAGELNPWSFDAAMKHILGEGNTTQKLWDEYQEFVKKDIALRNSHLNN